MTQPRAANRSSMFAMPDFVPRASPGENKTRTLDSTHVDRDGYESAMLTLGECRDRRLTILVGCDLCRTTRILELPEESTRFDDRAVGELFEQGVIRCGVHHSTATSLYIRTVAGSADRRCLLEIWPRNARG